jgi:hypothetical protein
MGNAVLTECRACEVIVAAEVLAQYSAVLDPRAGATERFTFARCPKCDSPLLTREQFYGVEDGKEVWSEPYRLYPAKDELVGPRIPRSVRNSFAEALNCFNAQAYSAAAMMCRRTLEGACAEAEIEGSSLRDCLDEMSGRGIVDARVLDWLNALAPLAETPGNEPVSRETAREVVEFTDALLSYLYTFRDRLEEFRQRHGIRTPKPTAERPLESVGAMNGDQPAT